MMKHTSQTMNNRSSIAPSTMARRQFIKMTAGAATLGSFGAARAAESEGTRHVWVLSDLHAGRVEGEKDGAEWFRLGCEDMKTAYPGIAYAMTLGDITHRGSEEQIGSYIKTRDGSGIKTWYELAGNHEYSKGDAAAYKRLIRSTDPYSIMDGNVVWIFLSTEKEGVQGHLEPGSCDWLEKELAKHQDKNVIVCSHQLIKGTTFKSEERQRQLHPVERLAEIIAKSKIDLWLHGHQHHTPYSKEHIAQLGGTTFINVASMSHAYGTGSSESYLLEFKRGAKEIVAHRRRHDTRSFVPEFKVQVPLRHPIQFGTE
jgi:hypothetical protein